MKSYNENFVENSTIVEYDVPQWTRLDRCNNTHALDYNVIFLMYLIYRFMVLSE